MLGKVRNGRGFSEFLRRGGGGYMVEHIETSTPRADMVSGSSGHWPIGCRQGCQRLMSRVMASSYSAFASGGAASSAGEIMNRRGNGKRAARGSQFIGGVSYRSCPAFREYASWRRSTPALLRLPNGSGAEDPVADIGSPAYRQVPLHALNRVDASPRSVLPADSLNPAISRNAAAFLMRCDPSSRSSTSLIRK